MFHVASSRAPWAVFWSCTHVARPPLCACVSACSVCRVHGSGPYLCIGGIRTSSWVHAYPPTCEFHQRWRTYPLYSQPTYMYQCVGLRDAFLVLGQAPHQPRWAWGLALPSEGGCNGISLQPSFLLTRWAAFVFHHPALPMFLCGPAWHVHGDTWRLSRGAAGLHSRSSCLG